MLSPIRSPGVLRGEGKGKGRQSDDLPLKKLTGFRLAKRETVPHLATKTFLQMKGELFTRNECTPFLQRWEYPLFGSDPKDSGTGHEMAYSNIDLTLEKIPPS
jgi:hypothetical protein